MQEINIGEELIYCDDCGKSFVHSCIKGKDDESKDEDIVKNSHSMCSDSHFCKTGTFLCKSCAQVKDGVLILDDADTLLEYFKLIEVFENLKKSFAVKKLEPFEEKFKGKLSIDFIKNLNPTAYKTLINSKHFGIKKEKHRIAQEYVKCAKKSLVNYMNLELFNDDLIGILRKEILEKQLDVICLKRQMKLPAKVYVHLEYTPQFYKDSSKYTGILEKACADGSNLGFSNDDCAIQNLFDKMPERIMRLNICKEKEGKEIMKEIEIRKAHPAFNFGDKKVYIDYIDRNKEDMIFIKPILCTVRKNRQLEKALLTQSAEKVYGFIGDFFSINETPFEGIHYREDCYEYLVELGLEPEIAIEIAEEVRKGRWRMKSGKYKKYVPQDFSEWAGGVKYLVSRRVIFEDFILIDNLPEEKLNNT